MKKLCLLISFIAASYLSFSQSSTWSVKFANAMISRYQPTINAMTGKGWEYSNAIILHGMEKVYNWTSDANYLNYIKTYVDTYVNASGGWTASAPAIVSLDKTHPGICALFLYEKTGLTKYKTIATTLRNMYVGPSATYTKTTNGGIFWHKLSGYDNICLIDGIYMLHPFLAKYGSLFGDNAALDTAINQTLYIYNQLYDNTTHLIKHAWTTTPGSYAWADASGKSKVIWSRGMGWFTMALVDILKYVPAGHAKRSQLITALSNLAIGIQTYQDPTSKLWYQVVDAGSSLSGNYLETSGSAMFVYAIKTAVDNGWISSSYLPVAQNGWTGLKTKISTYTDGLPAINDFAPAMSVQSSAANYVQASLQPVDAPVASGTQHPHGFAAIMMAASVMEFPLTTLPVKFTNVTANLQNGNVLLKWQNADYSELANYIVERSVNGKNFIAIAQAKPVSIDNEWIDVAPTGTLLYYRIKAVSINNSVVYSKTISIRKQSSVMQLKISPNPIKNGLVKLFVQGMEDGNYQLTISNSAGEALVSKSVFFNKNTGKEIRLPASASGILYVQIKGNNTTLNSSILVR